MCHYISVDHEAWRWVVWWHNRHGFPSLPFQHFRVLFNSLFKVLCIFPSPYLCAIDLPPICSFLWHLPHALCWNPNQHDLLKVSAVELQSPDKNGSLTLSAVLFQGTWFGNGFDDTFFRPQFGALPHVNANEVPADWLHRFTRWAFLCSVALTERIMIIFFSSAY